MKNKIIIIILMWLFLGITIFVLAKDEDKGTVPSPSSEQLPEVSPAHPIEKKEEKPSSSFLLAEPIIASPAQEE